MLQCIICKLRMHILYPLQHSTCTAIIGDCHIEKNSLNAVGVPMETAWAGPLYSCTPIGSSVNCRHEVHVISNHDAGPSSVVSVSLTMDGTSSSSKPVVLVLMNFKPIHWVLEIPDDVPVRQVVLVSSYILFRAATYIAVKI